MVWPLSLEGRGSTIMARVFRVFSPGTAPRERASKGSTMIWHRKALSGLMIGCFIAIYFVFLVLISPVYLFWPSRIRGLSYAKTVATRWILVRHAWRRLP